MKTFRQLMAETAAQKLQTPEPIDEQTVHVVPHGNRGTHFKVVKGIEGQLENGEVIHDSHIDDLHDIGIKVKVLKEDEMTDDEQLVFESEDVTELEDLFETEEELDEWSHPDEIAAQERLNQGDKPRTEDEEKKIARGQIHGDYKGHQAAMRKKHGIESNLGRMRNNQKKEVGVFRNGNRGGEGLYELSQETLRSYAAKGANDRTRQFGNERKYNNRLDGSDRAIKKLKSLSEIEVPAPQELNESWGHKVQSFSDFKRHAEDHASTTTTHGKVHYETSRVRSGDKSWNQTSAVVHGRFQDPPGSAVSVGHFNHTGKGASEEGFGQTLGYHDHDD